MSGDETRGVTSEGTARNAFAALHVGLQFSATHYFSPEEIRTAADLLGDDHFLHHDSERAVASRFGGLIASGAHSTGVMASVVSSYFSGQSLGLEIGFGLRGGVRAGETLTIVWTVEALEPKPRWDGGIVTVVGEARGERGDLVMTGRMKVLVSPRAIEGQPVGGSD